MRNLNEALINSRLDENEDNIVDVSEENLSKLNNDNGLTTDNNSKMKMNYIRNVKDSFTNSHGCLPKNNNFDFEVSSSKKNTCLNDAVDTFKLIVENYDEIRELTTNNFDSHNEEKYLIKSNSFEKKSNDNSQNEIKNSNVLISRIQMEDGLFKKVKNNLVFYY